MGSPISATAAGIVMEYIEETAISTALHPPKWWFRFVDDSHACLKRNLVNEFHSHLNSIDPHLQFTIELEENKRLPFLDYRKHTYTDKYLHYDSHHPTQHKLSVLNTLLDRAKKIPSTTKGKRRERKHVFKVLRDNGYPSKFLKSHGNKRKHHDLAPMPIHARLMSTTEHTPLITPPPTL